MIAAEVIRGLEEQLLQTSIRKNADIVSSMLAEEFREFGSSGRVFSKSEIIGLLQLELPLHVTIADWQVHMLTSQIALATYRALKRDVEGSVTESLRTSIWTYQSDRWQMLFHQGTKVPPD